MRRPVLPCCLVGLAAALATIAVAPAGAERTLLRIESAAGGGSELRVVPEAVWSAMNSNAAAEAAAARTRRRLWWRSELARHYRDRGAPAPAETPESEVRRASWRIDDRGQRHLAAAPVPPADWVGYWSDIGEDARRRLAALESAASQRGENRRVVAVMKLAGPPAPGWIVLGSAIGIVAGRLRWTCGRRCRRRGRETAGDAAGGASSAEDVPVVELEVPAPWLGRTGSGAAGRTGWDAAAVAVLAALAVSLAARLYGQPFALARLFWWPLAEVAALAGG